MKTLFLALALNFVCGFALAANVVTIQDDATLNEAVIAATSGAKINMVSSPGGEKIGSILKADGKLIELAYLANGKINGFAKEGKMFYIRISSRQSNTEMVSFDLYSGNKKVSVLKVPKQKDQDGNILEPTDVLSQFQSLPRNLQKLSAEDECAADPNCYTFDFESETFGGGGGGGVNGGNGGGSGGGPNMCQANESFCLNDCTFAYNRFQAVCAGVAASGFLLGPIGGAATILLGIQCSSDAANEQRGCQNTCNFTRFRCGS